MSDVIIAVVGLGYVGLPIAIEFGKKFPTIGFDTSKKKIELLASGQDPNGEVEKSAFELSRFFEPTSDSTEINRADFIIIAVPTPVDSTNNPDFSMLREASLCVGRNLKRGAIIIYESTVYPGATEELCLPIIERVSKLKWKDGFYLAYSPERINPGDKERSLPNITKVVSGDCDETLRKVSLLYSEIIDAGVYEASSIRVAEAAKVIENTQRDLNIALVNELAFIFHRLGIDTQEVLEAAETKWNFLPFKPGLVGGHCIGVDPYYLTHKAAEVGYHPEVILAGRRINDNVSKFIAQETVKYLIDLNVIIKRSQVTILGLTFKEDCSDVRNTKVVDLINHLEEFGLSVNVFDPVANPNDAEYSYGIHLSTWEELPIASAMISAVPHKQILDLPISKIEEKLLPSGLFVDVKSRSDKIELESKGFTVWRL